jgi:hypothetical protein
MKKLRFLHVFNFLNDVLDGHSKCRILWDLGGFEKCDSTRCRQSFSFPRVS